MAKEARPEAPQQRSDSDLDAHHRNVAVDLD